MTETKKRERKKAPGEERQDIRKAEGKERGSRKDKAKIDAKPTKPKSGLSLVEQTSTPFGRGSRRW